MHFKCTNFNSSAHVTVHWLYLCVIIKILSSSLKTMLIVDTHCSDVCCDKFPVPRINRKSKQVKEQWHEQFYLQSIWGKLAFKYRRYQNLWMNNKVGGDKNAICLHFLPFMLNISRKFEFLISQGSVTTCLRWGGYCISFVANFMCVPEVQNFENRLKFDKVTESLKVGTFFETQCRVIARSCGIKIFAMHCLVLSQSMRVTYIQTDGRTDRQKCDS